MSAPTTQQNLEDRLTEIERQLKVLNSSALYPTAPFLTTQPVVQYLAYAKQTLTQGPWNADFTEVSIPGLTFSITLTSQRLIRTECYAPFQKGTNTGYIEMYIRRGGTTLVNETSSPLLASGGVACLYVPALEVLPAGTYTYDVRSFAGSADVYSMISTAGGMNAYLMAQDWGPA